MRIGTENKPKYFIFCIIVDTFKQHSMISNSDLLTVFLLSTRIATLKRHQKTTFSSDSREIISLKDRKLNVNLANLIKYTLEISERKKSI